MNREKVVLSCGKPIVSCEKIESHLVRVAVKLWKNYYELRTYVGVISP
jgi:hypothetical protein